MLSVEQDDEQAIRDIVESFKGKRGITIQLLSKIQDTFGIYPKKLSAR